MNKFFWLEHCKPSALLTHLQIGKPVRISCNDEEKQDEAGMNRLCATKLGYAGGTTDDRRLVSCFGPEKEALERIHLLLSAFSVEKS